jgi:predicted GTPase
MSLALRGRRVLAVDDGPTLTHGGMPAGAAELAARRSGAVLVDPRPYARGSIRDVFAEYPTLGPVLPAVGYGPAQLDDLRATIDAVPCDLVLLGTPVDLRRALAVRLPVLRVRYDVEETGVARSRRCSPDSERSRASLPGGTLVAPCLQGRILPGAVRRGRPVLAGESRR